MEASGRGTEGATAPWTLSLSHGTLECRDIVKSRRFYSDFLGLETVQRGDVAVWVRCGGGWMVACVCTGDQAKPLPIEVRWCLDMRTSDEVDAARAAAVRYKDEYGIKDVLPVEGGRDGRSFCLQDLDGNWWEIAHRPGRLYDQAFGGPVRAGARQ